MEKMIWSAIAALWTLVITTAVWGQPLDSSGEKKSPVELTADLPIASSIPIVKASFVTPTRLLPIRVLDDPSSADAIGIILASGVCLRLVMNRRAV